MKKKVVIITGASMGIGRAVALALAENGFKVVLAARNKELLQDLKVKIDQNGGDALIIPTDVSDEESVKSLIQKTLEHHGSLDILVNNAGVGRFARADEFNVEDYNYMFDVNVKGVFLTTRYTVPHMISKKAGQIINIASVAGKTGFKSGTLYAASKHAVVGYTWSLREDLKEFGIKVSVVCPGSVVSGFGGKEPYYVEWSLEPDDVANAVMYLVNESDTANTAEMIVKPRYNPRNVN